MTDKVTKFIKAGIFTVVIAAALFAGMSAAIASVLYVVFEVEYGFLYVIAVFLFVMGGLNAIGDD